MRPLFAALLLLGSASPIARAQTTTAKPGVQTLVAARVDKVLKAAIQEKAFPGAVVGIADHGKIALIRGYGMADIEQGVPVTEKTVFRVGSVTKQFTAAGILRLADQGKLSIEDPLSKYFPDFPRAAEVNLRQLLSHTSGISSYTNPKLVKGDPRELARREYTAESMIAHIATLDPLYEFDPGTGWSYSNSGYILLGAIIEKVSGKSYRDFLKAEFFEPLNLHDTAVDEMTLIVPHRARGYDPYKDAPTGFVNTDFISLSTAWSAGAIRSTAADLLNWHLALFGGKVLKPETLAAMTAPAHLKDGRLSSKGRQPPFWVPETTEYGFGLFLDQIEGRQAVGHGGAINGFNTWMETFPSEGITMVILANSDYPAAEHTGPKLAKAVLRPRLLP